MPLHGSHALQPRKMYSEKSCPSGCEAGPGPLEDTEALSSCMGFCPHRKMATEPDISGANGTEGFK